MFRLLFGIVPYIIGREYIDKLYFYPSIVECKTSYKIIKNRNHCAIIRISDKKTNRCILISHGNAGNITNRDSLIEKMNNYDGDIYLYEYPGFGHLENLSLSVKNCIDEHIYWINILSKKYDKIDLYGESIGGGIVTETIKNLDSDLSGKIDKIYLQSTFTSIADVIKKSNTFLYYLYKGLLKDDLNTFENLSHLNFKNKEIIILHSKIDEIIPFSYAEQNYQICLNNNLNVKFIEIRGTHNNPQFSFTHIK
jgi:hypothetical protein